MARKKQTSFAREVPGLIYNYPFKVGDHCYFITKEGKVLTRTKKIIMEVGVPVEVSPSSITHKDYDGHIRREFIPSEVYEEGVRVKYDDGFDYTDGYQTNMKVTNLIKVKDYEQSLG